MARYVRIDSFTVVFRISAVASLTAKEKFGRCSNGSRMWLGVLLDPVFNVSNAQKTTERS